MAEPYLGEIRMFAGNFAINGWATCNGQTLAISSNTALFSILGTNFGGNGTTTFMLPNLQGRVAIHQGSGAGLSTYFVGQSGGIENVTLTSSQLPSHNHTLVSSSAEPNTKTPAGNYLAPGARNGALLYSTTPGTVAALNPSSVGAAGSSLPFGIIQPYLSVTFLIALVGIFPSRN